MGAREDEGRNEDTRRKRERKKDGGVGTSCSSTWGLLRVSRSVVLLVAFERFRTGCPSCLFDVSIAARSIEPSLDQNNRECDPFVAVITIRHRQSKHKLSQRWLSYRKTFCWCARSSFYPWRSLRSNSHPTTIIEISPIIDSSGRSGFTKNLFELVTIVMMIEIFNRARREIGAGTICSP